MSPRACIRLQRPSQASWVTRGLPLGGLTATSTNMP
ncbi:hypothetical protein BMETH_356_2 [methanotrophic bacterial endosymbiont of Bathymodiolus sp.]|nr:hypothetical protein BMETH_356_2 [methanotrophic bacterial endosymbiont of Bathymodiolus sp.]